MERQQDIAWYPGHMAKARRLLKDQLSRVDIIIELCDARLPLSSRNPELNLLAPQKPRLLLLNKADLADPILTRKWLSFFQQSGLMALAVEAGKKKQPILKAIDELTKEKIGRAEARGLTRSARAMVIGVPNVGKSTLINFLAGRGAAKVQDRPGITRAPQWIKAGERLELLDTPGLLWPKLGDPVAARRLAFIAAIRDEVLNVYQLALQLLEELVKKYPQGLKSRYSLENLNARGQALLEEICLRRGFLNRGGEADLERGAVCVLDEFREGRLGRVTLESPAEAILEQA